MIVTTLTKFGAIVVLAAVEEGCLDTTNRTCCMLGNFVMTADMTIRDAVQYDWDLIVIPGGGESPLGISILLDMVK